jgi:hypothetical protein
VQEFVCGLGHHPAREHAADRAQTFQDFRRYVQELRERKQAERDAERRRPAQDTVKVVP